MSLTLSDLERQFGYNGATVDYLTHILPQQNALYFEVPKTGCTAFKLILRHVQDPTNQLRPTEVHDRQTSPLLRPMQVGSSIEDIFGSDRFYRFTCVRNPYTRVLSAYLDKLVHNTWERDRRLPLLGFASDSRPSFLDFLQKIAGVPPTKLDIHWMPQSLILGNNSTAFDDVFRFETIDSSLDQIKGKLGVSQDNWTVDQPGKHHKTNAHQRLAEFYSDAEIALVKTLYHNDFEQFHYSANSPFQST